MFIFPIVYQYSIEESGTFRQFRAVRHESIVREDVAFDVQVAPVEDAVKKPISGHARDFVVI